MTHIDVFPPLFRAPTQVVDPMTRRTRSCLRGRAPFNLRSGRRSGASGG